MPPGVLWPGVLLPAALCAIAYGLFGSSPLRPLARRPGLGGLALLAAFLGAWGASFHWPPLPPRQAADWIFWAWPSVLLLAALLPRRGGAALAAFLGLAATQALAYAHLIARGDARPLWFAEIGGLALITALASRALEPLATRRGSRFLLSALTLYAGAAAALLAWEGSARLGQGAGIAASGLGVLSLAAWWRPSPEGARGVVAPLLVSLALAASQTYHYGDGASLPLLLLLLPPPFLIAALGRKLRG